MLKVSSTNPKEIKNFNVWYGGFPVHPLMKEINLSLLQFMEQETKSRKPSCGYVAHMKEPALILCH